MKVYKTRKGNEMDLQLRQRIIEVFVNPLNVGKQYKELASIIGISVCTLRNYRTDELLAEVDQLKAGLSTGWLEQVDQAMITKAMRGDTTAAKLVYARLSEQQRQRELSETLPQDLDALNQRIAELEKKIGALEHA